MAEEVYKEEAKTVEELQAEIAALKQELADVKAQSQSTEEAAASVVKAMEQSTEDKDVKVEMLCRWAAARAGAIVIAPLVGTVALMANEVYLVSRIARVYDVKLSERALIAFLGAVGSRVAGSLLTTIIPFSAIQVPVAVGITYSLGRVTQRWLKDGMPTDMGPYIDMIGDETIDFMKKWGGVAKERFQDVKEKGEELYHTVRHHDDLVDEIVEEKAEETKDGEAGKAETAAAEAATAAGTDAKAETAAPADSEGLSVEDKVKAAVEDAKIPLEDKK